MILVNGKPLENVDLIKGRRADFREKLKVG